MCAKRKKNISINERYTFFSNGIISAIDVLLALIERRETEQIEIMLATWQLGIKDAERLKTIAAHKNVNLKIVLDVSYKDRNPDYFKRVKNWLGNNIWLTSNHTKVMLIGTKEEKYVVLSSANLNRNFRFEFFDITESSKLYAKVQENYEPFFLSSPIKTDKNERPIIRDRFESIFTQKDSQAANSLGLESYEVELYELEEINF